MAFEGVNIPLNYQTTEAENSLKRLQTTLQGVEGSTKSLQDVSQKLFGIYGSGFASAKMTVEGIKATYDALFKIMGSGIGKAQAYGLEVAKLKGVLSSQGKDVSLADDLEKLAGVLSKQSLFGKGEILGAERLFFTFDKMNQTLIPQAIEASVGLATVFDRDLKSATMALGKALESPAEGMKALRRMGVIFDDATKEMIKTAEAEGDTYKAQQIILDELGKKYKDVADAMRDTDAFKIAQMEKTYNAMQKQAGAIEAKVFMPTVIGLGKMMDAFNKMPAPLVGITGAVIQLSAAYALLNTTGIGATIKGILTMGPSIRSVTLAKLEATIMTKTMTAAEQQLALAEYEAALASKGFFASMGPIGWTIIAVGAMATAWGLLGSNVEGAKETLSEEEKQAGKNKVQFEDLTKIIKDSTKSEQEKYAAKKNIISQYSEYLGGVSAETSSQKEWNMALANGVFLLEKQMKIKSQEKLMQTDIDEVVKAESEVNKLKEKLKTASTTKSAAGYKVGFAGSISEHDEILLEIVQKQKLVDAAKKKYDATKNSLLEASVSEKPDDIAKGLLAETTGGLTENAVTEYIGKLEAVRKNLKLGSAMWEEVQDRINKEQKSTRFEKTGGGGLGRFREDAKIDLQNAEDIAGFYTTLSTKWEEIKSIKGTDSKGLPDVAKTGQLQQKARFDLKGEAERDLEKLISTKVRETEVTTAAAGGSKAEVLSAKLKTLSDMLTAVEAQRKSWTGGGKDEFPLISRVKMLELGNDKVKLQTDLNKERYDAKVKGLDNSEGIFDKLLEMEKGSDVARLINKETSLRLKLAVAKKYHQDEKAAELAHQMELLDIDKVIKQRSIDRAGADNTMDIGISGAQRTADSSGSTKDVVIAEKLAEAKKWEDEKRAIDDNVNLTEAQKNLRKEEIEQAHLQRMGDIQSKHYANKVAEMLGMGDKEVETANKIQANVEALWSAIYDMQNKAGQAAADSYRTNETSKLETDKKAELARARTDAQKTAIEDKYAAKKEAIDNEANKQGQAKIKTMFEIQKAVQIANALINTYSGATAALAPPPIGAGPLMGPILAGTTIAAGLANIAVISQQEMPKFARGGLVYGPGTSTSDSINARLSAGEYVVNARSASANLGLLEGINRGNNTSYSNSALVSELRDLRRDLVARPMVASVLIGDSDCRRIASKGINRIKSEKY